MAEPYSKTTQLALCERSNLPLTLLAEDDLQGLLLRGATRHSDQLGRRGVKKAKQVPTRQFLWHSQKSDAIFCQGLKGLKISLTKDSIVHMQNITIMEKICAGR